MIKTLKIAQIVTDAGTQVRVRLDEATVEEYAEAMRAGVKFPPLEVFHDGAQYLLADGFHRLMGALRAEVSTFPCEIHTGGRVDCLKYALGANAKHGLRMTNADKRNAVMLALKEFPRLSAVATAEMCGVSDEFVRLLRKSQDPTVGSSISVSTSQSTPELKGRTGSPEMCIGRDGKEYPARRPIPPPPSPTAIISHLNTPPGSHSAILNTPPAASRGGPPPPPPAIRCDNIAPEPAVPKDRTGHPIPPALFELWDRAEAVQQAILTPLSTIRGMVRRAQDQKDQVFAEVNFSSLMAHLDQAYADAGRAKPHAVCPTCQGKLPERCATCHGRGFVSEFFWSSCVPRETKELRAKAARR